MRRLKVGIRPQLIILVMSLSLLLLLILAVVTGVYFSNNLLDLRAERLEVIAELKLTQIGQLMTLTYYQVNWITQRDLVLSALANYRVGNSLLDSPFMSGANLTIDQLVLSSDNFAAARLYNLDMEVLVELENKITNLSPWARDYLYPLRYNAEVPPPLYLSGIALTGYFTGPVANDTLEDLLPNLPYFMCITLPIYANTLIILTLMFLAGYISVIFSTQLIQLAMSDAKANSLQKSTYSDNQVYLVQPIYGDTTDLIPYTVPPTNHDHSEVVAYKYVLPTGNMLQSTSELYNINSSQAVKKAILEPGQGLSRKIALDNGKVATGFSKIHIDSVTTWTLLVEQPRSQFLQPVNNFKKIIIGVVIGIAAFMCIVTFPLAVYFVKPITQLKDATVLITNLRKPKHRADGTGTTPDNPNGGKSISNVYWPLRRRTPHSHSHHYDEKHELALALANPRNLVLLTPSLARSSAYLLGIRMPEQVPRSKKFFKDEITELTEAFNIMTAELARQYNHLEDRVKQRTKELEALKVEAEAANEAKTVFIANISHELRTPLNGILGMTAIAMDEPDQLRIQESLKLIHRSGELLLHILTELLTYSKNTLKRLKLERANFQILEVVGQTKLIFDKLARDLRVHFSVLVKPAIMRKLILFGDLNRIIQIVMNLVLNSLKFTPVDGLVDVQFKLLGEYDYERLMAVNCEKVYVKNLRKLLRAKALPPVPGQLKLKTLHDGRRRGLDNTKSLNSSSSTTTDLDHSDNISVVTLPTLEYEQALFRNQFQAKPLPTLPQPNPDNSGLGSLDTMLAGLALVKSMLTLATPPPLPPKPQQMNQQQIVNTLYDLQLVLLVATHHEVTKNDKVYKTRTLANPTTWVIQISVTDTGPGIEPALQEKVFEPFIQGDQTLLRSYGGTGLGLSICRQLATMMHGTLTLLLTIGKGLTFTFTVPLKQTGEVIVDEQDMEEYCNDEFNPDAKVNRKVAFEEPGTPNSAIEVINDEVVPQTPNKTGDPTKSESPRRDQEPSPVSSQQGTPPKKPLFTRENLVLLSKPDLITKGLTGTAALMVLKETLEEPDVMLSLTHIRILVAEDNMVNQEVIKRMLKLEGFTNVKMAKDGSEAVEMVRESYETMQLYDLIFMDVQMPKIDGLLATKMIRTNLGFTRPIIALTAFADELNVKECLGAGMSGFLAKPIRRSNIKKVITQFAPQLLGEVLVLPSLEARGFRFGDLSRNTPSGTPISEVPPGTADNASGGIGNGVGTVSANVSAHASETAISPEGGKPKANDCVIAEETKEETNAAKVEEERTAATLATPKEPTEQPAPGADSSNTKEPSSIPLIEVNKAEVVEEKKEVEEEKNEAKQSTNAKSKEGNDVVESYDK